MIFVKRDTDYLDDVVGTADLVEWTSSNDQHDPDYDSVAACAAAAT